MFEKKRKRAAKRPIDIVMFYSNNDLFTSSYLTEALDKNSNRCLYFVLKKSNNTKEKFTTSYKDIIEGAEISGPRYVQKSLKLLSELGLIEVGIEKGKLTVRVLKTAKKLATNRLK